MKGRIMAWLNNHLFGQQRRLAAASADAIHARAALRKATQEATASARESRREAVITRREARLQSRRIEHQSLRTGTVFQLVDEMMLGFETKGDDGQ